MDDEGREVLEVRRKRRRFTQGRERDQAGHRGSGRSVMEATFHERLRMMRAIYLALFVLSCGCARSVPVEPMPAEAAVGSPVAPPSAQGAGEIHHASDLGGRAVERAAAPDTPALEPMESFGKAPRPRSTTVR